MPATLERKPTHPERPPHVYVGTAGWQVPAHHRSAFADTGSHLARYASRFAAVEINSSFYRPHAARVYERWAAAVPDSFRFAVKCPKLITHESRLRNTRRPLERFLNEIAGLGPKLGPILLQLAPSHEFELARVKRFLTLLRARHAGSIVCEPRHATWLSPAADRLLVDFSIARVAADPARAPGFECPGGWTGFVYYRWHGSPRMYWSEYTPEALEQHAQRLRAARVETWTIFDNTAAGTAVGNALTLVDMLARRPSSS